MVYITRKKTLRRRVEPDGKSDSFLRLFCVGRVNL